MTTDELKTRLLEASELQEIDHLMNLPNWTVLEQMEAHLLDYKRMIRETCERDVRGGHSVDQEACYHSFCTLLDRYRKIISRAMD